MLTFTTTISQENVSAEKFEVAKEVFDNLKKAKGLLPNQKPTLHLVKKLPNVRFVLAMANNTSGDIYLQERSFDICMEFMGKDSINGLAFILAHELAHFTKKHFVRQRFIEKFQTGDTLKSDIRQVTNSRLDIEQSSLDSLVEAYREVAIKYQIRKNEAEADLEAGLTSYLAGYRSIEAGPKFLELAYQAFRLKRTGGNYASLEERKEIVRQTGLRLDSLVHIFEMGNYLSVAGAHEEALGCYAYVSRVYQSKELFNNIGVLSLLQISKSLCGPLLDYALPITLDLGPEMNFGDGSPEDRKRIYLELVSLFETAIETFDKASSMDDRYYLSDLNKSIAYVLMHAVDENFSENELFRNDYLSHAYSSALNARRKVLETAPLDSILASDILNQLALVSHARKEKDKADDYLNEALRLNPSNVAAQTNQKVFSRTGMANREFLNPPPNQNNCIGDERVFDEQTIDELSSDVKEWEIDMIIDTQTEGITTTDFRVRFFENEQYKIYQWQKKVQNLGRGVTYSFFETKPSYDHPTLCEVAQDQSEREISDHYGQPDARLKTATGNLMHYLEKKSDLFEESTEVEEIEMEHRTSGNGIIFNLNESQEINNWVLYTKTINR